MPNGHICLKNGETHVPGPAQGGEDELTNNMTDTLEVCFQKITKYNFFF